MRVRDARRKYFYKICKYVPGETFLLFFLFLFEVWIKPKLEFGSELRST